VTPAILDFGFAIERLAREPLLAHPLTRSPAHPKPLERQIRNPKHEIRSKFQTSNSNNQNTIGRSVLRSHAAFAFWDFCHLDLFRASDSGFRV